MSGLNWRVFYLTQTFFHSHRYSYIKFNIHIAFKIKLFYIYNLGKLQFLFLLSEIFVLNEIDLEVFTTLTEENLMELGIAAFGARKKLLTAIHTLLANEAACSTMPSSSSSQNSSSPRFSGSAAPGAERRPSNQW